MAPPVDTGELAAGLALGPQVDRHRHRRRALSARPGPRDLAAQRATQTWVGVVDRPAAGPCDLIAGRRAGLGTGGRRLRAGASSSVQHPDARPSPRSPTRWTPVPSNPPGRYRPDGARPGHRRRRQWQVVDAPARIQVVGDPDPPEWVCGGVDLGEIALEVIDLREHLHI